MLGRCPQHSQGTPEARNSAGGDIRAPVGASSGTATWVARRSLGSLGLEALDTSKGEKRGQKPVPKLTETDRN